jgi:GNAT superfamily N-acetyltransferase
LREDSILKPFDCGNNDLNGFLLDDSKIYSKYLRYTTTVLESKEKIIAYYSLANDLLTVRDMEDFREETETNIRIEIDYWEQFYRQVSYPAVKIGRLAVDREFQSNGLGTMIINSLIKSFTDNNKTGCQFITVDAINDHNKQRTIKFYEQNGFNFLTRTDIGEDSRLMYRPLLKGLFP